MTQKMDAVTHLLSHLPLVCEQVHTDQQWCDLVLAIIKMFQNSQQDVNYSQQGGCVTIPHLWMKWNSVFEDIISEGPGIINTSPSFL